MILVTDIQPKASKWHSCHRVIATGYFGDMDEMLYYDDVFADNLIEQRTLEGVIDVYLKLLESQCNFELANEMEEYLKSLGYTEDEVDNIDIPRDNASYEMLPTGIESFEIEWYDEKGVCYAVTVDDLNP
jgi:hypothetical protein